MLVDRLRAGWDDQTPAGVATVMMTDVPDWAARWEHAPEALPAMLAEMQLVVDRAVERHAGRRVASTDGGDTTTSVFAGAASAVAAAVEVQRTMRERPVGLNPRVGLATGDLIELGTAVHGPGINRAGLVRDLAQAGRDPDVQHPPPTSCGRRCRPASRCSNWERTYWVGSTAPTTSSAVVADGVSHPPDPSRSPYPGLASFEVADADLFVGRDGVIAQCLDLFSASAFVAVVGASGSGKTSLALAGIAARLADVVVVRPGHDPLTAWAQAVGKRPSGGGAR